MRSADAAGSNPSSSYTVRETQPCSCGSTTSPKPTTTQLSTSTSTTVTTIKADDYCGYYSWSWASGSQGPPCANHGVAFTGWPTIPQSINDWNNGHGQQLKGTKWLSVGGGNHNGIFNANNVDSIISDCTSLMLVSLGWDGIMFDVETVSDSSSIMIPKFDAAFAACKQAGLRVGITVSHSAPFSTPTPQDAVDLVKSWCQNGQNVEVISPQLYSTGLETTPEFAPTFSCASAGCGWDLYKDCQPKLAPSIVAENQYEQVKEWVANELGLQSAGFFQWAQVA